MGRRHREKRAAVKKAIHKNGWYENELGELKKRMTKAEARERLLERQRAYLEVERQIVEAISRTAIEDIQRAEDARVFELLDEAGVPPLPAP